MEKCSSSKRRRDVLYFIAGSVVFLLALFLLMLVSPAGGGEQQAEESVDEQTTGSTESEQAGDNPRETLKNPYLGQKEAIEEGELIYRGRCIGCHKTRGGRGPNIFKSKLTDKEFLETVMNGRKGTNMPAFRDLFSVDEIWKVHALVMSRDRL